MSGWTDERFELLRALYKEGLSASQIAKKLGGVSRCAVIGKIHRDMPLADRNARPSAPRRAAALFDPTKTRRAKPRSYILSNAVIQRNEAPPPRVAFVERDEPAGLCRSIMDLQPHVCRWPIGDPQLESFSFCGKRTERSYCEAHAARAYDQRPKTSTNDLARSLRRHVA